MYVHQITILYPTKIYEYIMSKKKTYIEIEKEAGLLGGKGFNIFIM